jgi:hypothetical protein
MSGHFESNAVSDVMSFSPRLSGHFLFTFFLAAVKHKKIGGTTILKGLILCHRRWILRSKWALARLQGSDQRIKLLRFKRAAERRHVVSAINESDN